MPNLLWPLLALLLLPSLAIAAPRAAIVVDADTREILYAEDIDAGLHPAQLVQLMTNFVALDAIAQGEITLDSSVYVSSRSVAQPRPHFGLREGQQVRLRYLIAASAAANGNDAAHAIAEAVAWRHDAFVERMNETAAALCMTQTQFANATGQTDWWQRSTAHDLAILGAEIHHRFPMLFERTLAEHLPADGEARLGTHARMAEEIGNVSALMTGYQHEAGFVAFASIRREGRNLIVIVLGEARRASLPTRIEAVVRSALDAAEATLGFLDHCQLS